jgi:hypothetical protein
MNLQDRIAGEQRIANDTFVKVINLVQADGASTYTMKASERTLIVNSGHTSNTMTVTLPPVQECAGQFYYIGAPFGDAGNTTTVEDDGGDAAFSDLTMDADDDHVLLYSTGHRWLVVTNGIA